MYDEAGYWNARENPNSPESKELDVKYLKKHLVDANFALDFGPGVGRTFDAYEKQTAICGYDITSRYFELARQRAEELGLCYVPIFVRKIEPIKFPKKFFDAAVCCEVLLHQRPENIEFIMKDLLRVSSKVIVVTYQNLDAEFDTEGSFNHCYNHDYRGICERNGWKMKHVKQTSNQLFFVYHD